MTPQLRTRCPARFAVLVTLGITGLGGCAPGHDVGEPAASTAKSVTTDPAPEPADEPPLPEPNPDLESLEPESPAPVLADSWADGLGYTYTFALETAVGNATTDIANAPPGHALVSWTYTFAGTIANTTPQRNAPAPAYLVVQPVWPADSVICTFKDQAIIRGFASNAEGMEERWCTVSAFPSTLNPESRDVPMASAISASSTSRSMRPLVVPEDEADSFVAALQSPALWALGRNEGEGWLTDCLMMSGSFYLTQATAETTCRASGS